MKIITIAGKARSGKDTSATMMSEHLRNRGERVLITHYADLLKYILKNFFGWDGVKDDTGRYLLQKVGTDIIRNDNPDYWVGFLADMFRLFPNEWDYVIIPDCRFPNEITYFLDHGYDTYSVRIERENSGSPLTKEQLNHASETSLDDYKFDYTIHNDGTLKELLSKARDIAKDIHSNI